jgi:hypothetical protein
MPRAAQLLLVAITGCCSRATLDAANRHRDELRAALVADYDPDVSPRRRAATCPSSPSTT